MASWLGLALTLAVVFAGGMLGGMSRFALTKLIGSARAATFARELGDLITAGQHRQALRYALRTAVIGIVAAWFGMRWGLRAFAG